MRRRLERLYEVAETNQTYPRPFQRVVHVVDDDQFLGVWTT